MVKCFICGEEVPPERYPEHMDTHAAGHLPEVMKGIPAPPKPESKIAEMWSRLLNQLVDAKNEELAAYYNYEKMAEFAQVSGLASQANQLRKIAEEELNHARALLSEIAEIQEKIRRGEATTS
jgi:hypothetical protein